jgi:hypothetical protein
MASGGTARTVTIWQRGQRGLYADDHGVTVQSSARRIRRIAWAEISRFAEVISEEPKLGGYVWGVSIFLHTGKKVSAIPGWYRADAPEIATAIRQVCQVHGIPADLTGTLDKDGKPAARGLYDDPWGQAGLRYWDGTYWSPLLRLEAGKSGGKSTASWAALPIADVPWTYAADHARRSAVWMAIWAAVSAAALIVGLVILLWWDHAGHHKHLSGTAWFVLAPTAAWLVPLAWYGRRTYLALDKAAKESGG